MALLPTYVTINIGQDLHDATLTTDTVQLFLAGECRVHEKERIVSSAEPDER
jgi:hypothetical protein